MAGISEDIVNGITGTVLSPQANTDHPPEGALTPSGNYSLSPLSMESATEKPLIRADYLENGKIVWWTLDEAFAFGTLQGLIFRHKYSFRYALLAYKRKLPPKKREAIGAPCRKTPYPRWLVQDFVAGRRAGS